MNLLRLLFLCFCVGWIPVAAFGQDQQDADLTAETERRPVWRKVLSGINGNFAFSMPLQRSDPQQRPGLSSQGEEALVPSLLATFNYTPKAYWFLTTTFYVYFPDRNQAAWDPDFSYRFGYEDWHPFTFSLTYSNYGGNRLVPKSSQGEKFTRFDEGTLDLGWKFELPTHWTNRLKVHDTSSLGLRFDYYLTPRYEDQLSNARRSGKQSLGFTARYVVYKWWFVMASMRYYPKKSQQQSWDPDIVYEFGYFDWHPGTLSIRYSNYSGTRYPWRNAATNTGAFRHGAVSVAWSWAL